MRYRASANSLAGGNVTTTRINDADSRLAMSTTITVRIEDEIRKRLDRLAESTQRSKSFLAAEAIREFVEANEWQIAEIRAALAETDAGDFATPEEVATLSRKWQVNA